jgi:hypothetical protein
MKKWYEAKTGNDQGLVIEEETGRNVAVVYDKADAPLIAVAPELLEACKEFVRKCECGEAHSTRSYARMKAAINEAGRI